MKKLILTTTAVTVGLFGMTMFYSCQKESTEITDSTSKANEPMQIMSSSESSTEMSSITLEWRWIWDEWGRAKRDCAGGGLCNFRRDPEQQGNNVASFKQSPFFQDENGSYYVEVWVDEDLVFEDSSKKLYIDEDIINVGSDGITVVAPKGEYPINMSLGVYGAYEIPVMIYE
ncbi:MAG: hypothetical protein QM642_06350 [Edaphocola sp.]